jgi:hypothetical protein
MNTEQIKPAPMSEIQLKGIKKQIIQTYLFLIGKTDYDPLALTCFVSIRRLQLCCTEVFKDERRTSNVQR